MTSKYNEDYKLLKDIDDDNLSSYMDIKNSMSDLEIPAELEPENMMKKLEMLETNEENESIKRKNTKKKIIWFTSIASAVAMIALAITMTLSYYGFFDVVTTENGDKVVSDSGVRVDAGIDGFYKIKSYKELYEYFQKQDRYESFENFFDVNYNGLGNIKLESTEGSFDSSVAVPDEEMDTSDTNVRTDGVSEADVVKTDGKHIYIISDSKKIQVLKAAGADSNIIYTIEPLEGIEDIYNKMIKESYIRDMYIEDGKLAVVIEVYEEPEKKEVTYKQDMSVSYISDCICYVIDDKASTIVKTYDISDIDKKTAPVIGDIIVDGDYESSRMKDGYLYLFTSKMIDKENDYKPMIDNEYCGEDKVYISSYADYSIYNIITSVFMNNPDEVYDSTAIIYSYGVEYYVSLENIYFYSSMYEKDEMRTEILKFEYKEGKITPVAAEKIVGTIKDSFCIDECKGYLRIVVNTTKGGNSNSLYILDENLDKVGEIVDIAKGERVYSARFMGDIGYFVTYYQVDPLFSVDLSNPKEPKIIGALKIPGFSEYLHAFGPNMLLGIGKEGEEIKLSMFDISDPSDVTEENKYILDDIYYTPLFDNYKAVLIDYDKNIIGFAIMGDDMVISNGNAELIDVMKYVIYEYNESGFELKASVDLFVDHWYESIEDTRGVYVGDYLYVINAQWGISVLDMNTYEKVVEIDNFLA